MSISSFFLYAVYLLLTAHLHCSQKTLLKELYNIDLSNPQKNIGHDPNIIVPKIPGIVLLVAHGFALRENQQKYYCTSFLDKGHRYRAVVAPHFRDAMQHKQPSKKIFATTSDSVEMTYSINLGQKRDAETLLYALIALVKRNHTIDLYGHSRGCAAIETLKNMLLFPKKYMSTWRKFSLTELGEEKNTCCLPILTKRKDKPNERVITYLRQKIKHVIYNKPLLDINKTVILNQMSSSQKNVLKNSLSLVNKLDDYTLSLDPSDQAFQLFKENIKANNSVGKKTMIIFAKKDEIVGNALDKEVEALTKNKKDHSILWVEEEHNDEFFASTVCKLLTHKKKAMEILKRRKRSQSL